MPITIKRTPNYVAGKQVRIPPGAGTINLGKPPAPPPPPSPQITLNGSPLVPHVAFNIDYLATAVLNSTYEDKSCVIVTRTIDTPPVEIFSGTAESLDLSTIPFWDHFGTTYYEQNYDNKMLYQFTVFVSGYVTDFNVLVSPPAIETSDLRLHLDAGFSSYPAQGSTWVDRSGFGVNCNLVNSPTYYGGTGSPLTGQYISFGGTSSWGEVDASYGNLKPTGGITQAVWVKLPDTYGVRIATSLQYGTGTDNSYALFVLGGNWNGLIRTADGVSYYAGAPASSGVWQYVVHTYDGSIQRMYLNGVPGATSALSGLIVYDEGNTKWTVGANYDGPGYNSGITGDPIGPTSSVQIYGRALTAGEVVANFNAEAAAHGLAPIVP